MRSYTCSMEYGNRLRTYTDPPGKETLYPSRSAVVTSQLYDGSTVAIPVMAVAKAPGWVCVRQTLGNDLTWLAWVPQDRVRPA